MAKFCTKCGKKLEEGEICTCEQVQPNAQPNEQEFRQDQMGGQYQQQGQPYVDPNYQQQGQYYQQQGQPYGDPNYQQGQYQQQGQPYGNPNYQQQGQYYQQGQPYGNPYNQQGMTKEAEWFSQKKNALVSGTKNMFSEILPILKAPVSRVRQIAESNNAAVGIEFIVTKTVASLLVLLLAIMKIKSMMGMASDYVKIPYFKLIFLTLVLTVGADFLEALFLKAFTGLFNGATHFNAMITVVGARTLYETLIILVTGILVLIYPTLGLGFYGLTALILPYIEFGGYQASVQCDENKKVYAFFLVQLCIKIILAILVGAMVGGIVTSLAGGMMNNLSGLSDLF